MELDALPPFDYESLNGLFEDEVPEVMADEPTAKRARKSAENSEEANSDDENSEEANSDDENGEDSFRKLRVSRAVHGAFLVFREKADAVKVKRAFREHIQTVFFCEYGASAFHRLMMGEYLVMRGMRGSYRLLREWSDDVKDKFGIAKPGGWGRTFVYLMQVGVLLKHLGLENTEVFKRFATHLDITLEGFRKRLRNAEIFNTVSERLPFADAVGRVLESPLAFRFLYTFDVDEARAFYQPERDIYRLDGFEQLNGAWMWGSSYFTEELERCIERLPVCVKQMVLVCAILEDLRNRRSVPKSAKDKMAAFRAWMRL